MYVSKSMSVCVLNFKIFYCLSPLLDSTFYQIKGYVLYVMFTAICTFSVLSRSSVVIFIYVYMCVYVPLLFLWQNIHKYIFKIYLNMT